MEHCIRFLEDAIDKFSLEISGRKSVAMAPERLNLSGLEIAHTQQISVASKDASFLRARDAPRIKEPRSADRAVDIRLHSKSSQEKWRPAHLGRLLYVAHDVRASKALVDGFRT
ncbi:MAG: hypothetical protein WA369_14555 [Candidatus Acidiferrales bacterium]